MRRKFDGYKIYFHNFSNFDGIFFMKELTNLTNNLNPIIDDDGNFINLQFKFDKRYSISFRDSYLLFHSTS